MSDSDSARITSGAVEAALYRLDEAIGALIETEQAQEELAVDFVETKGEYEFVHRIFHILRHQGVDVHLEQRRVDLIIEDVKVEAKVMHAHLILSAVRKDRGLNDFLAGDLPALLSGRADLLLAIVPRFAKGIHAKYPGSVGAHELGRFGHDPDTWVAAAHSVAHKFQETHQVTWRRRWPIPLRDASGDLAVELYVWAFARPYTS